MPAPCPRRAKARRVATVSIPCSPTAPTGRAAPMIRSRRAACNTPPAPHRARRRYCGPMQMRCGAPRSTPRMRIWHAGDVHQTYLPLFHTNALAYSMLASLWVGATCVIQPRFSASRFWDVALEHGCTWTSTIPFCMKALLEHEIPKNHKFRLWGTAVNDPPPFAAFGVKTIGWWGMTETITHGIIGEVDQPNTPMSIGRAAPEYQIRIVEDDGSPTEVGGTGNLLIKGITGLSLFAEYLHNETATTESFDEHGYFVTGDRVTLLD